MALASTWTIEMTRKLGEKQVRWRGNWKQQERSIYGHSPRAYEINMPDWHGSTSSLLCEAWSLREIKALTLNLLIRQVDLPVEFHDWIQVLKCWNMFIWCVKLLQPVMYQWMIFFFILVVAVLIWAMIKHKWMSLSCHFSNDHAPVNVP